MKKSLGFNLVELMVAIAMSTTVIVAITTAYSTLYSSYTFNNNKVIMQQNLRFALSVISHDLENAGVFGSISFHNLASAYVLDSIGNCNNDWCSYDMATVGVKSYSIGSEVNKAGIISSLGSDVLRIQRGGAKIAYYQSTAAYSAGDPNSFVQLNFYVPISNQTSAVTYMLASSNHAYLINLNSAASNNSLSASLPVESVAGGVFFDPDQSTMVLAPFYTKYYFINNTGAYGESGLYVKTYNGISLSSAQLVAKGITSLNIRYRVDTTSGINHIINNATSTAGSYRWCTTAQMGTNNCQWINVTTTNVILSGQSEMAVSSNFTPLSQIENISISWLW